MGKYRGNLSKAQRSALAQLTDEWKTPTQIGAPPKTLHALVTWREAEMDSGGRFRLFRETGISLKKG